MASLTLKNIAKSYKEVRVLHDINLDIKQGELMVFVGPSGCGKSTLLRMIAGLEKITGGSLSIDGQEMNQVPPSQRGIAMVFQSYALYPHMTVRDNMAFALKIAKKSKQEINEVVEKTAEILQLTDYLDRLPKALSGGQRQRVAIGRAIVRDPKVFLFDEPLSNLDAALRVATRIEIAQLKEKMPEATMIYVTHDQVEAMTLASRIVVLNQGYVEQVGTPLELYERPANEFVARFIGSPAMNMIPVTVAATGETTTLTLPGGHTLAVPLPTLENDKDKTFTLGVRPEDVVVNQSQDDFLFEAPVNYVEALGEVTLIYFSSEKKGESMIAKISGIHDFKRGQSLRLSAPLEKLHLFDDSKQSVLYR